MTPLNVLFICSQNQWRSPTAEKVWHKTEGISVRSAGTSSKAKRHLSVKDIRWADLIFVMEEKHKSRIRANFRDEIKYKEIHILDIPDEFQYMDPELIEIIKEKTEPLILNQQPES